MSRNDLSPHQQAVVDDANTRLLVKAAAGSGKTRALVWRYVRLVAADGLSPEQILTVTFTRKAAAEMKRRIVARLRGEGLVGAAQLAETGPIQTLHGFCERILRENSLAIGADPNFDVMDPATISLELDQAIRSAIRLGENDSDESVAIRVFSGARAYGEMDANSQLFASIEAVVDKCRGGSATIEQIEAIHRDQASYMDFVRRSWIDELPEIGINLPEGPEFYSEFANALKRARLSPGWLPGPTAVARFVENEQIQAQVSCGIAKIACRAWRTLEARMIEEQSFDFAFLESQAVRLIETDSLVASKLRRQYKAVLIDEAQDLNPVQYRLLRALDPENELMVGDHQQSIYGFRLADVRLFNQRASISHTLALPTNYRAAPGVLRFVDHVFAKLWPNDYVPMLDPSELGEGIDGVEFWDLATTDSVQIAEWVHELCQENEPGDVAVLVAKGKTADVMRHQLEAFDVPSRIAGGGVAFYTRMEVRDVANLLIALSDPGDDFAMAALLRSPFAAVSLDTVVLLCREKGIAFRIESFDTAVTDDLPHLASLWAWFKPISLLADRLPAWEVIAQVFERSPYFERLVRRPGGLQQLANVRKLLSLATSMPEMGPVAFARHIRHIQEFKHREGDAESVDETDRSVSIMTIHKSKGLEFPVVVLAETDQRMASSARPVEVERDLGIVAASIPGIKDVKWIVRDWIASKRKDLEREESIRTLYVALTRAQRKLIIVGAKRSGTLGGLIRSVLDLDRSPPAGLRIRKPESTP